MSMGQLMLLKETDEDYAYDEAIRTLRTNLQFSGRNVRAIMFTSSMPDEGKSDISLSIARSLAQIGKKTVLVDMDIRKSVLLSRCRVKGEGDGLSQYLSGQRVLKDIIFETNEENLSLIFAGPFSPNPAELLEEELCGQMFEALRISYDYIIVDTPPMASLTDGAIVARHCDGAVIVIESGAISYRLEQKVKSQLEKTGCRILGTVLNKVDVNEKGYYGKYGKYGKYGEYNKYGGYGRYEKSEKSEKRGKRAKKGKNVSAGSEQDNPPKPRHEIEYWDLNDSEGPADSYEP